MKELKKIAIALVGFCVCFLVLDFGVGKFFDWAIKQMPSEGERVAKSEYVLNKVDADFLVIGSSRAEAHYDSKIIQDSFPEYSVYNCGVDGQMFYYSTAAFNSLIERHTPKVVVWDFQVKDLVDESPENLSLLYPYYRSKKDVKSELDIIDPSLKYVLWCNCYRYNGSASRILRALNMHEKNNLGYKPLPVVKQEIPVLNDMTFNKPIIKDKVELLSLALQKAKDKGIHVYLCISPYYVDLKENHPTVVKLQELADKYGHTFLNLSQMEELKWNDAMWYDGAHLNSDGATLFTKKLISLISQKK